ncbi:MAG: tetratricopeptide repeat protein [Planctomycetota bacterium]|nr:tetratricopeptide repeat protein [Planctomycetota bacterium]
MTIEQTLQQARNHQQAGRLREAEVLCAQALSAQPEHPDALHLMGIILFASGRPADAIEFVSRAAEKAPWNAEMQSNLGVLHAASGQRDQAIERYRRAIEISPRFQPPYHHLGNALMSIGNLDEAIARFQQALQLRPNWPEVLGRLGDAVYRKGRVDEAIALYQQALQIRPAAAGIHNNLGNALRSKGMIEQAIACYQQAIHLQPNLADGYVNLGSTLVHAGQPGAGIPFIEKAVQLNPNSADMIYNLGNGLIEVGRDTEAIECYRRALALRPNWADALNNLSNALKSQGHLEEAEACVRASLVAEPNHLLAHNNLGDVLFHSGKLDEAEKACLRAIELDPAFPAPHWNLALILLSQGRLAEGWKEFAWRRRVEKFPMSKQRHQEPLWDGSPLKGKRILIHAEQGLGDTIQFVRYLPRVHQLDGTIVLEAQRWLFDLLANFPAIERLVAIDEPPVPRDVQYPLMDLPMLFGTTLETIPADVPYLFADATKAAQWRARLGDGTEPKIGIAWAGRPTHLNDKHRSLSVAMLAGLLETPGVRFISLQKGDASTQAKSNPSLLDLTDDISNFADTAALIENLDLVISVDTSVAHLAGAMGKPTWVLLPFTADWRWMRDREDSPWYPTMRLFRQPRLGDWQPTLTRLQQALRKLVESRQ